VLDRPSTSLQVSGQCYWICVYFHTHPFLFCTFIVQVLSSAQVTSDPRYLLIIWDSKVATWLIYNSQISSILTFCQYLSRSWTLVFVFVLWDFLEACTYDTRFWGVLTCLLHFISSLYAWGHLWHALFWAFTSTFIILLIDWKEFAYRLVDWVVKNNIYELYTLLYTSVWYSIFFYKHRISCQI